jgi:hypothetical protein
MSESASNYYDDDYHYHGTCWSRNTGIWAIVAAIVVFAIIWFVYKVNNDKIAQGIEVATIKGRVECIAPQVQANEGRLFETIGQVNRNTSASTVYADEVNKNLMALNNRVFYSNYGSSNCSNNGSCQQRTGFIKTDNYTLCDSNLQNVQTCGGIV